MSVTFGILSIICFAAAGVLLFRNRFLAPVASYFGLMAASFIDVDGISWLHINSTILIFWLCATVVVMTATMLQPRSVSADNHGMGYMAAGGLTGLAAGLLGCTLTESLTSLYAMMIGATALGVALGFLLYTNTPAGRAYGPASGRFLRYLCAKGFPTALTLMMAGVPLVLIIAIYRA